MQCFQRNNFIRFHLLHWVDSSTDIWFAIRWSIQRLNILMSSLKTKQSPASNILFLSKWLNTSMSFLIYFNLPGLQKSHKEHDKEAVQCKQSKQTLELWKRHFTNSLFQEFKSSLHTQDFHQVQQESRSHSGRSNDTLLAWTFLDIKLCSLI